ncbi:MAG: hypothetical protein V4685_09555 [Bacteroidota bacterium]
MKKRFLFMVLLCAGVYLTLPSCKKETITVIQTVTDQSVMGLLTNRQWKPDTVYYNYPAAPTLAYARGRSGNTVNLDNGRFVFWRDGTEDVFGYPASPHVYSTWTFTGIDSSLLFFPTTATYQRILKLDATHFHTYDSTNSTKNIFTLKL